MGKEQMSTSSLLEEGGETHVDDAGGDDKTSLFRSYNIVFTVLVSLLLLGNMALFLWSNLRYVLSGHWVVDVHIYI